MPDDSTILNALVVNFRRRIADTTLTLAALKTVAATALAALAANTTIINIQLEGGGSSAVMNCNPAIVLAAAEQVIAENGATDIGTGVAHLDLSGCRIES